MAKLSINLATGSVQDKELIVGIDLGTTNSLIAVVKQEDGNRVPVALRDIDGLTLVPSVIHFDDNNNIIVGNEAKKQLVGKPSQTIYSVKRLLGKSYKDLADQQSMGYQIIDDGTDSLVKIEINGKYYSPIELSAFILKELKKRAEHVLKQEVNKAVITVPAYFNDSQRQATRDAGKLAGLDVLRIINEPTAAALAYGLGIKQDEGKLIAVYDLGGGTFDVSILRISNGIFEVLSTHGDTALGGDDFDMLIFNYWRTVGKVSKNLVNNESLRAMATEAKIALNTSGSYLKNIGDFELTFEHSVFYALSQPLIDRTLDSCRLALKDAGLTIQDIESVIMVGGSTRLKIVQEAAKGFFGIHLNNDLNPDEVVALGAAIQADILAGNNTDMLLLDVTPLSLGIETANGLMDILITRNSKVPGKASRQYTTQKDGQMGIVVSVYQGERDLVKDNRKLAEFTLKGIPPMQAGFPKVEISFMIDADGILTVSARELRSGVAQQIAVKPQYGLTDAQVEQMLSDSLTHAQEDIEARSLAEAVAEANQMLDTTEGFLKRHGDHLNEDERTITIAGYEVVKQAINTNIKDAIIAATEALNEATRPFAERVMNEAVSTALKEKNINTV